MNTENLSALWEQLLQDPGTVWTQLSERFQAMSARLDGSDASIELIIMLAGAFILGFLFCSSGRSKAKR